MWGTGHLHVFEGIFMSTKSGTLPAPLSTNQRMELRAGPYPSPPLPLSLSSGTASTAPAPTGCRSTACARANTTRGTPTAAVAVPVAVVAVAVAVAASDAVPPGALTGDASSPLRLPSPSNTAGEWDHEPASPLSSSLPHAPVLPAPSSRRNCGLRATGETRAAEPGCHPARALGTIPVQKVYLKDMPSMLGAWARALGDTVPEGTGPTLACARALGLTWATGKPPGPRRPGGPDAGGTWEWPSMSRSSTGCTEARDVLRPRAGIGALTLASPVGGPTRAGAAAGTTAATGAMTAAAAALAGTAVSAIKAVSELVLPPRHMASTTSANARGLGVDAICGASSGPPSTKSGLPTVWAEGREAEARLGAATPTPDPTVGGVHARGAPTGCSASGAEGAPTPT